MQRLQSKQVRFFLVFVLPLVLLGIILGALQVSTRALVPLEQGVKAGYSVAVLIWLSFVLSIVADAALIGIAAFNTFNDKPVNKRLLRLGVAGGVAAVVVVFLIIQFGTKILTPLEAGIAGGEVPLSLAGIASLLALFGTGGAFFYATKFKAIPFVLHPDGGIKTEEVVVSMPDAGTTQPEKALHSSAAEHLPDQVQPQAGSERPAPILSDAHSTESGTVPASPQPQPQPQPQASHPPQEPSPVVSIQDLKLVESFVSRRDFDLLSGQSQSGEDRDLIQTKANVAEWILLSLRLGGKVAKTKLESSFEEQFPKIYVPLFNSVLYDLIYKGKVDSVKEGSRMMLMLKDDSQEGGSGPSKT